VLSTFPILTANSEMVWKANPTALIISAIVSIALLLILIIKFKMQALVAIVISAITIGIGVGMPYSMIISTVQKGMGNTLQGIALLVGLGSMFGAILEISGGAETIASTLVNKFGESKAAWALGITGVIVAIPVFFDAGLIILIPLAYGLAKKTGKSSLFYAIPLLAGLAVGHAFIPPTPGPILVANQLKVDLGLVILLGIICGIPAMIVAGPIFGNFIGKKIFVPVPEHAATQLDFKGKKLPSFKTVVSIILIPLILILLNTGANLIEKYNPAIKSIKPILNFIGEPFVALTIATLAAMYLLGTRHGYSRKELEKVMTKSLEPTGLILLVTAGGGVLRFMLQDSGLGDVIGNAIQGKNMPLIVIAFLVALAVRVSVGSATVAMTMAAGIMASMPQVQALSQLHLAAMTMAIAGGSTAVSHVNDSGFWLVKGFFELDEKTTLKTWTVMETLVGVVGFLVALIISLFA
jgi:GntP family gluconate:H+ symporter/Gnt-I system low-affinity gluconate transporter